MWEQDRAEREEPPQAMRHAGGGGGGGESGEGGGGDGGDDVGGEDEGREWAGRGLDLRDGDGQTPLHLAAAAARAQVCGRGGGAGVRRTVTQLRTGRATGAGLVRDERCGTAAGASLFASLLPSCAPGLGAGPVAPRRGRLSQALPPRAGPPARRPAHVPAGHKGRAG